MMMLDEQIKTYVTSLIRTVVPILVGNLLGWLTLVGVPLPPDVGENLSGLIILVTGALFGIGYYALVRRLEIRWPAFGILLGKAKQPLSYSAAPVQENAVIARALDATRDRAPDEQGEGPVDLTHEPRHRAGGRRVRVMDETAEVFAHE